MLQSEGEGRLLRKCVVRKLYSSILQKKVSVYGRKGLTEDANGEASALRDHLASDPTKNGECRALLTKSPHRLRLCRYQTNLSRGPN